MTPSELTQIRERLEKATPGPWVSKGKYKYGHIYAMHDGKPAQAGVDTTSTYAVIATLDNAAFIAHAPTDIAALLGEVERLRLALSKAEEQLEIMLRENVGAL